MSEQDDFLREFLVESHENLDQLDGEFVALEEDPSSAETLSSIFRTIHTIKGTCGFLELSRLESVTHAGENLLSALRDGKIRLDEEITTALLRLVDAVREMLAHIEQHGTESDQEYGELVAVLERLQQPSETGSTESTDEASAAPEAAGEEPAADTDLEPTTPAEESVLSALLDYDTVRLGEILRAEGLDENLLNYVLGLQAAGDKRRLGEILATVGVSPEKIQHALTVQAELNEPGPGPRTETSIAASNIRVQVEQLDKLMNLAGELVLARNQILQSAATSHDGQTVATAQRLNLITTELQERIMKVRMQPVGMLWSKFPRVVRDLSRQLGKSVRLQMKGVETELDKTLLEAIKDPLTHLVRNAVDHGVEAPEVRAAAGKDPEGTILLAAYHESGQVHIEIIDDGGGIDVETLKAKALTKGLITSDDAKTMSDRQAFSLIFHAGLSTAKVVSNVSGRGVGMDVVKSNIEEIGGTVEISSELGRGTTVRIKIPLTLAIIPALIITTGGARYAIPQVSLVELVRLDGEDARTGIENLHGSPVYRLRGELLPLLFLDEQLEIEGETSEDGDLSRNIVVVRAADQLFGLVVGDINDTEEIVVKPLDQQTKSVPVYAGTTILGDGQVALILDVGGIARRAGVLAEEGQDRHLQDLVGSDGTSWNTSTFLLLQTADGHRMAIELSDVDRLEEFKAERIELSGRQEVVQYRGRIMPLLRLANALGFASQTADESEAIHVVVHSRGDSRVGLVVDSITDIVEVQDPVMSTSDCPGIKNAVVIEGQVTDLLDLETLVQKLAHGATAREESEEPEESGGVGTRQFCTFFLGDLFFGVDVMQVQEVLRDQPMTGVPLTDPVVSGLINLRGQTVTALDMRHRLGLPPRSREDGGDPSKRPMNLVLRTRDGIVSILVDRIGDVLTVEDSLRSPVPNTVSAEVRDLLTDVYKLPGELLLPLDIERLVCIPTHAEAS